jgi:hypothetical protein
MFSIADADVSSNFSSECCAESRFSPSFFSVFLNYIEIINMKAGKQDALVRLG